MKNISNETINFDKYYFELVTRSKRIIISNVCPSIPNKLIESAIWDLNLQLAGIPDKEYNHILSFRRQAYITPTVENIDIQTSVIIPYEGNNYRIFISTDIMQYFICKQSNHIASNCPNSTSVDPEESKITAHTDTPMESEITAHANISAEQNTSSPTDFSSSSETLQNLNDSHRTDQKRIHPSSSDQNSPPETPEIDLLSPPDPHPMLLP
ncbi:unnamed protein product [Psylliodes chrysocephalus]|uniref:Uncharacterized protein n=1 Tax=Psylliodes chrysocephalus TaxID=3402493 RepID=A0A9P0CIR2_9CUCU|nr:unnamed protein product [Psylliodes chrysocephala]